MDILDTRLMHPRDQIIMIINRIYKRGLTTTSGGNVSVLDDNGHIWVTPASVDKGSLRPSDIMCVKNDGTVAGPHKPSSEFPFHKAIYQERPDIKAIIHAHPPALVSFSIVHDKPDTNVIPQAKNICGPIGYAPYALPGSEELGNNISAVFKKGFMAVIMENHGTVVGGSDIRDAFQRFETLEFCALTIINSRMVGETRYLSDETIKNYEAHIERPVPEMKSALYPSDEREKRLDILTIVKRACEQGLMISSYGTVSVRWNNNDFLITPADVSRWDLQLHDIVQIKEGQREPGKYPSRAVWLHQKIYSDNPGINSIITTQSPYLMAFVVSGQKLDVRTIPESWIFLQDFPAAPFGSQFKDEQVILDLIADNNPAIIIENDCVMVTGDKLLNTFDRLEVAEFSAKSITLSKVIGKFVPINDKQVSALRDKFL